MSDSEERDGAAARERRPLSRRHRFVVEVDGLPQLGFTEVDGLAVTVESRAEAGPDETEEERWWDIRDSLTRVAAAAGLNRTASSPNLTLRRGVGEEPILWDWLQDWVAGRVEPRTVTVSLLDGAGEATVGWVCEAAKPVEWTGPTLDADRPGVAMEELELAHDGLSATTDPPVTPLPLASPTAEGPFLEEPR